MIRACIFTMFALLALSACKTSGKEASTQAPSETPAVEAKAPPAAAPAAAADDRPAPKNDDELPMLGFRNAKRARGFLVGGAMTPDDVAQAAQKGYKRIIDVRTPDEPGVAEERAKAEELGISYILLPMAHEDGLTEDNAKKFAELTARDAGPTIIHCASGNRVGALFALAAYYVDKQPAEKALEIGKETGLSGLEAAVRQKLGL